MSEQFSFIVGRNWNCWAYEPPEVRSDGTQLQNQDVWWESDTAVARVYLNGQWTTPTNAVPGVYAIKTTTQTSSSPFLLTDWNAINVNEWSYNGTTGFICSEPNAYVCDYSVRLTGASYSSANTGVGYHSATVDTPYTIDGAANQRIYFAFVSKSTSGSSYNASSMSSGGVNQAKATCVVEPCRPQVNYNLNLNAGATALQLKFQVYKVGPAVWIDYAVVNVPASASAQSVMFSVCPDLNIGDEFRLICAGPGTATIASSSRIDIQDQLPVTTQVTTQVKKNGVTISTQNSVVNSVQVDQTRTISGSLRFTAALNDVISLEVIPANSGITASSAALNLTPDP